MGARCLSSHEQMFDDEQNRISYGFWECICGKVFEKDGPGDMECPHCEVTFNASGQTLCDQEYWGEETGEHPADVASAFDCRQGMVLTPEQEIKLHLDDVENGVADLSEAVEKLTKVLADLVAEVQEIKRKQSP